jgi:hypothetical protein
MIEIISTSEGIKNGYKKMKGPQKSGVEGGNQEIADSILEYKKDDKGKEGEQEMRREKTFDMSDHFESKISISNRGI